MSNHFHIFIYVPKAEEIDEGVSIEAIAKPTSAVLEAVVVQADSRTRRASFLFTVKGRGAAG